MTDRQKHVTGSQKRRLAAGLAGIFLLVAVMAGAWLVATGSSLPWDRDMMGALALTARRDPAWEIALAQWLSWLGDGARRPFWLLAGVALALGWRRLIPAFLFVSAFAMAIFISDAIKEITARARPRITPWLDDPHSASFPSGHATAAMALALGLAFAVPAGRPRAWALVLGLPLAIAIGISRVLLGVHWPSDVIAGWALGAGMVLCLAAMAGDP